MEDVDQYTVSNSLQRRDVELLLEEMVPRLCWAREETVLDVGCGPGDVTSRVLQPRLPPSTSVFGVDVAPSFIKHANLRHSSPNLKFKVVDFARDISQTQSLPLEQFSKVFSFYCLHWIQDQSQVVRNVSQLLRPGGQAVLLYMCRISGMTVFKLMADMDLWKPYMKGLEDYLSPFYDCQKPSKEMARLLRAEGLEPELCQDRVYTHTYSSLDALVDSNMAVNPFTSLLPAPLVPRYRADMEALLLQHGLCQILPDSRARIQYLVLVVQCRKSSHPLLGQDVTEIG